jgi:hypothetical protein
MTQYSMAEYGTVQHSAVHNIPQYRIAQYGTAQHSTNRAENVGD